MDWFEEKYDQTCSATPVLIHKSAVLHQKASARQGAQVITFDRLSALREAVRKFAAAIAADNAFKMPDEVAKHLATWHLNSKKFIQHWGTDTQRG